MTKELAAFISFFADEEALRSAIEGLLNRRDGCSGIRNLHGKDENGKDLIFYEPAGLGRMRLYACVVKVGKITGSASDPKSGARNVMIQCQQALDTPVLSTEGQAEWVNHVFVMCPNELSATAMDSISGLFGNKASQIEFICGNDLLRLFRDLWPDFIVFQPDLLSAHLDSLGRELKSDTNIEKLATVHGLSTSVRKKNIYIEPSLFQVRGEISRGVTLLTELDLRGPILQSQVEELGESICSVATSLRVVEYLPSSYKKKLDIMQKKLRAWPKRIKASWLETFNRAANEARMRNEPMGRAVPISNGIVSDFLSSEEYRYTTDVYNELDQEITDSNAQIAGMSDKLALLGSPLFAQYASLSHATTTCFPMVRCHEEGRYEWLPSEVLAPGRNVLVTGAPGYGKTSFCRNHFLADLEKYKTGSNVLPLYFAAHSIEVTGRESFEEMFVRQEVAAKLKADSGLCVRIYLDGLDEIGSKELRDAVIRIAKQACAATDSRYHCVATAREHVGGYWTNWLSRVRLSPMSEARLQELVTAWLDGNVELISRFYSELEHSQSLIPVLGVPLLATLTVLVFKNLHRLPENRLRLYEMFIDSLLGGWNLAKGLQRNSKYSSTAKRLILARLAGYLHARKLKECDRSHLLATLKQATPVLEVEAESVIAELVEDGLLLPTGRSTYTFPHLSFQEYLAAKDAIDPSRQEEKRIVRSYLAGDDWYKEVANFIVSMTTHPIKMRGWISELVKPLASPGALSNAEKRGAELIARVAETFPESKSASAYCQIQK